MGEVVSWQHVAAIVAGFAFVMWLFSRARIRKLEGEVPLTCEAIEERLQFQRSKKQERDVVKAIEAVLEENRMLRENRRR